MDIHTSDIRRAQIWSLLDKEGDPERSAAVERLCRTLEVTPVTARLLCNRGYDDPARAELFLGNDERIWHDPFLLKDMDLAVDRVLAAVGSGETIAVYGDYDVDGVTSVTSLYLYLTGLGANVINYIPSRIREGYGMSRKGLDTLAAQGATLIITVDTGITADREIAYAATLGMDTVVTDHHECHADLPVCTAVVNPHRPDCPYPFKELAGVGVVFKFICACETARRGGDREAAFRAMQERFIDLVAIGTIADVMPLSDENRFIVSHGLTMLDHTQRPGLTALLDAISGRGNVRSAAGVPYTKKPRRKVNSGLVGFGIAPRINAAGRISHAMKAVELLLAESPDQAQALAEELCEINTRRQVEENRIAEQAYRMIDEQMAGTPEALRNRQVLVLDDDGWMQGIVGIVASRMTEKYGLPSILISFDGTVGDVPSGDDLGKGSGRSVKGLNLVEALAFCEDTLVRFGGHELAAGLTIRRADIPAFREKINEYAATHLTDDMTAVRYDADCKVTMADMTMAQAQELDRLEPYGVGNQTPVFLMEDVLIHRMVGLGGGRHTKLTLYADGQMMQAVWFGVPPEQVPAVVGDRVDVLFNLNINDFQGVRSLQMILEDLRPSEVRASVRRRARIRYDEICDGAPFLPEEGILPDREDIAKVYTCLRAYARKGIHSLRERELVEAGAQQEQSLAVFVKLWLILRILNEMQVCRILEAGDGIFSFDIPDGASRTSVEASPLYCRLRTQCRTE